MYPLLYPQINSLDFHPSGSFLLSTSNDHTLKVCDLREGQLMYTLHGHEGATSSACFSPGGEFFASAGADEQVMVWRTNFDREMGARAPLSVSPLRVKSMAPGAGWSQRGAALHCAASGHRGRTSVLSNELLC